MNTLVRLNSRCAPSQAAYPDRLDDLFAGFFRPIADSARGGNEPIRIDVTEDANAYRVNASLAGVKKDDIHVTVDQNEVTISTEFKREALAKEGETLLHRERYTGKATRVFSVAQDVDEANVQAKFVDGVLELVLPKKAPVSAKRVNIA